MKKYLRYADVLVLFTGALGLFLRLIIAMGGTDDKGLYPKNHPAWVILCILSVAVIGVLFLLTRQVGANQHYRDNFPASLPGAIGAGLAAVGIVFTAFDLFAFSLINVLIFAAGLAAMGGLLLSAYCRYTGRKPHFLCHAVPAVFFALRLFLLGKDLGAEPEASRYLFEMLASLVMIPACYQLWGFDVDMGKRDKCLFWTLTAAYLCIVAIVGVENWLLYLSCAVWMLTGTCRLQFLPKKLRRAAETEPEAETAETEDAPQEAPADAEPTPAPVTEPIEEIDPEAILAEILREIDKTVE